MDTMSGMKLFLETVKSGSFSSAGRRLGLGSTSIARQVSGLEKALGTKLLHRNTRKLSLTEAGEHYYRQAAHILNQVSLLNETVANLKNEPYGVLRMSLPASFGRLHIAPLLTSFMQRHPQIRIEALLTDRIIDLYEEKIDIAVRTGELVNPSVVARKLANDVRLLCASPTYLASHPPVLRARDLHEQTCLTYQYEDHHVVWHFYGQMGVESVPVRGALSVNNIEILYQTALDGLGIALLPKWLVAKDLLAGRLENVLPHLQVSPTGQEMAISLVYLPDVNLPTKTRAFINHLLAAFTPDPPWEH
jgi:DNA-binding transcriptional LysR family regulator